MESSLAECCMDMAHRSSSAWRLLDVHSAGDERPAPGWLSPGGWSESSAGCAACMSICEGRVRKRSRVATGNMRLARGAARRSWPVPRSPAGEILHPEFFCLPEQSGLNCRRFRRIPLLLRQPRESTVLSSWQSLNTPPSGHPFVGWHGQRCCRRHYSFTSWSPLACGSSGSLEFSATPPCGSY